MDKLRRRDGWRCTPLSHAEGAAMRERGWVQKRGAPKPRYILDLR
jgi:hypothetical protein